RVARAPAKKDGESLLLAAALVVCVVTSPAGWAMGFVWALPVVPIALCFIRDERAPRLPRWSLAGAWVACTIAPPFAGWVAVAGTALAVALAWEGTARVGDECSSWRPASRWVP